MLSFARECLHFISHVRCSRLFLVLFTDYCTVLHTFDTFCRKFNLFIVNNFDSVLQLSIGKLCSSNSVWRLPAEYPATYFHLIE